MDLISNALPVGGLWDSGVFPAGHMMQWIRVYNEAGNVIQTHEHAGDFKEW